MHTAMHAPALALLLLLLRSSLQQSGDFSDDDEEPGNVLRPDFDCFSKIRMNNVLLCCNVAPPPPGNMTNIRFEIQKESEHFSKPWTKNPTEFLLYLREYEVCMVWKKSHVCHFFNVRRIAIPDRPHNVTTIYNKDLEEYEINIYVSYIKDEYLGESLEHELVLRSEGTAWLDCKDETYLAGQHKLCFKIRNLVLYIPKRNLEYSTKYEARARSKPAEFYDGSWSPWSATTTFKTEEDMATDPRQGNDWDMTSTVPIVLSTSIPFFLLIVVILIAVFWKSKIKPFVWPEIPDHKKTLEKLCAKPKQNIHLSFSPYHSEIIPINKIDYIKAPEITEDSDEVGIAERSTDITSANTCNTNLSPAEGSRGPLTNANHTGPSDNMADIGEKKLENSLNSVTSALLPGDGVSEKCNISNGSDGIKPVSVRHPGQGSKGLCWEDIYIAMSAFKTPSSAVKQVPKSPQGITL
ncbi:interleukin-7 receptor subunit alpha [Anomaloglossus baeobatrachus]|uniref:interleukin-7 receptor subunit alpha n=1 Tax=Anomaloglossus baeobatrachus TaxID=238106 RepID=UPI003F50D0FC